MKLTESLEGASRKIKQFINRGEVVQTTTSKDLRSHFPELAEKLARQQLLRLFTDQEILKSLGAISRSSTSFQKARENFARLQAEYGIKSNLIPTLTDHLGGEYLRNMAVTLAGREKILSLIPENKRSVIEGEVLLVARNQLTEKLKQPGLSRDYYNGASEMLKRIENHLKTDIAPTEKNSK